ncbi:MAG: DUF3352 domain-containing protein [Candidatus Sericytochromatia bacterium]|nr:DUF3352 domain-containing protein [Candidatus Sericytochromatia bacterium]
MIFRKPALLACSLLLSSALTLPAFANQDTNLSSYSDDTAGLVSISMNLGRWLKNAERLLKKSPEVTVSVNKEEDESGSENVDIREGFDEVNQMVREELGIDLFWDVLANLGDQVSVAYRPWPGRAGDLLLNLDLRSGDRAEKVLNKLYEAQSKTDTDTFLRERYGPYTLFTMVLEDSDDTYNRLQVAIAGNHLMASLGPDPTQLKNMLYISSVLPADSRFRLVNQQHFKPLQNHLQDSAGWLYADGEAIYKLVEELLADELSEGLGAGDMALIKALVPLYRGLGLSFDIEDQGLLFKSYVAYDQAKLSPVQQAYVKATSTRSAQLPQVLKQIPASVALLSAGDNLDLAFKTPLPVEPEILAESELASELDLSVMDDLMQEFINVSPTEDLEPYMDGRYGLAAFEAKGTLQHVFYLGLKPNQAEAFEQNMMGKFKVGLEGLFGMLAGELGELENAEEALAQEAIRFEAGENYQGVQFYSLQGLPIPEEMRNFVAPVAARKGDLWMLAQSPLALKAALDSTGQQSPVFQKLKQAYSPQAAAAYFFLDITRSLQMIQSLAGADQDVADLVNLLKAWKSLYASSEMSPEGMAGKAFVGINFQEIDLNNSMLKELFEFFDAGDFDTDMYEEDYDEDSAYDDDEDGSYDDEDSAYDDEDSASDDDSTAEEATESVE